jgi:hypothetical protein
MDKSTKEEQDRVLKIFDEAFGEFLRDGSVMTACCHVCNGLIHIEALSPYAWRMKCPCGRCNGNMKGL